MKNAIIRSAVLACATLLGTYPAWCEHALAPAMPDYVPFAGHSGYQEIRVAEDSWYVAFHGTRDHNIQSVDAAWAARAAELCNSLGAAYFVQLKYEGEAVLDGEKISRETRRRTWMRNAGAVFIPIYVPRSSGSAMIFYTPSKMAAVRCLKSSDGLRDPKRLQSGADALLAARQMGIKLP